MSELRHVTRHAGTVLVGQLAVMAYGLTDTVVAGRYSEAALAALSVGAAIFVSVYVSLQAIAQALLPVYAEAWGAQKPADVGKAFRQGLWLAVLITAVGTAVLARPDVLMDWADVPGDLRAEISNYLGVLALAFAPALLFRMISTLTQAIGRPQVVTMLQIASLIVKVPLSVWLTFGGAGVGPMGVVGCAWATLIVNLILAALGVGLLRWLPVYQPFRIWSRLERPNWATIGSYARLGVPGGLATMVEVTSFTLMALFISRMGNSASAAHQIAANLTAMCYMVPLSIGIAASARVSYWIGAGEHARARAVAALSVRLALGLAALFCVVLLAGRHWIASLYSTQPAVVATAAGLLLWVAPYHVADACQGVCSFLLRSYRVTVLPFIVYALFLWGIGLGGGYWLAYSGSATLPAMMHPRAFWIAAAASTLIVAIIFALMLGRASSRHSPRPREAPA